jgi:hypothetical protein
MTVPQEIAGIDEPRARAGPKRVHAPSQTVGPDSG